MRRRTCYLPVKRKRQEIKISQEGSRLTEVMLTSYSFVISPFSFLFSRFSMQASELFQKRTIL